MWSLWRRKCETVIDPVSLNFRGDISSTQTKNLPTLNSAEATGLLDRNRADESTIRSCEGG